MPPCDKPHSLNHLHSHHNSNHPYPVLEQLQSAASAQNDILVMNEDGVVESWPWFEITAQSLTDRHSGSTLPPGALLPMQFLNNEFDFLKTFIMCYCAKKLSKDMPMEGARAQIRLTTSDSTRHRWVIQCHLWHPRLKRFGCGYFVEAEDIFRARGGYDPTDPRIATPLSRPVLQITTSVAVAASASVSTPTKPTKKPHQKISRPQLSSTEGSAGEIIPPSSPFASSPPRYHFDPFRGHVPSSVSSNGSIIPSSVKTELSSPVAHQQQQRGERAITISDDEPDFTLVEVNLTGTRQPDADNTPTPKAIKTKSKTKGKGRATALPVESSEDERQPNFRGVLITNMRATAGNHTPNPFAQGSRPIDVFKDGDGAIHYRPGDVSPKKRLHAGSVSSAALGHIENRARRGSISTALQQVPPGPSSSFSSGVSSPPYWVGSATHPAGNFPQGLQQDNPSPYDPYTTPHRPPFATGQVSALRSPTPVSELELMTLRERLEQAEAKEALLAHLDVHSDPVVLAWRSLSTIGGVDLTVWLHAWGFRLCPDCSNVVAGAVAEHRDHPSCAKTHVVDEVELHAGVPVTRQRHY